MCMLKQYNENQHLLQNPKTLQTVLPPKTTTMIVYEEDWYGVIVWNGLFSMKQTELNFAKAPIFISQNLEIFRQLAQQTFILP